MTRSFVQSPGVVGIRSVERFDPPGDSHATNFVVVVQTDPTRTPIAYRVNSTAEMELLGKPPFESELIHRFRRRRRKKIAAWTKATAQVLVVVTSIGIACLTFFGAIQLRVVLSESMSGTFEKGDVLLSVNPSIVPPKVGDIAIFHYYNLERTELIADFSHRIIGGSPEAGWQTKGDANAEAELSPVLRDDVVGVVVGWMPWVGNLLQPNIMILIVAGVFVAYVGAPELRDRIRTRKTN